MTECKKRPVVLVVMDGIGEGRDYDGNAVSKARTPNLDALKKNCVYTKLKAHGTAVGLPSDGDMGNSEVGHNALGSGQICSQGAKLVSESIESGAVFESAAWRELRDNCLENGSTMHFLGLLSDGNVHSNIAHLFALMEGARAQGIARVRVHILLDGRDVPATSAGDYIAALEKKLNELNCPSFDGKIASGGGRMKITMDRYEADWAMVERGWRTHAEGEGRQFSSAMEALESLRAEAPGIIDQDIPPFVIAENGKPVGKMTDRDSVILFNFRGDRAMEISRAFDEEGFDKFTRSVRPKYAGLLQYDGDLKIPRSYLVEPPVITNTLTGLLVRNGVPQYAVSETQKFGHVTYFWNGNRSGVSDPKLESFEEITSDRVSFDERPWMKCADITDRLIAALESGRYGFLRCNYPNGDMVGHTGGLEATIIGVEAVDLCLGRLVEAVKKQNAVLIVTADHGNADEMTSTDKKGSIQPKTSHTLNPVPFILMDSEKRELGEGAFGLANVAATVAGLLGLEPEKSWEPPIIKL